MNRIPQPHTLGEPMTGYALRFISGKYQGGEFPLVPGKEVIVGRSSELDMVLVEDMVSRKHARIANSGKRIVITDLGSTNGTFVNGEKVQQSELNEGDRILIGTSILKLVRAEEGDRPSMPQAIEPSASDTRQQSTMSGTLEEVPVPDLLQLFSTSKRTGILVIKSQIGVGKIYMRQGDVYYASIDDDHELGPMKAFCRVVGWEHGGFEFAPPEDEAEFVLELEDSTEALLMEAMRQLDEFRRISKELPAPGRRLIVPAPLQPALTDLEPADLEVFQLVHSYQVTQTVFNRAAGTDYETASRLLNLISQGYVSEAQA